MRSCTCFVLFLSLTREEVHLPFIRKGHCCPAPFSSATVQPEVEGFDYCGLTQGGTAVVLQTAEAITSRGAYAFHPFYPTMQLALCSTGIWPKCLVVKIHNMRKIRFQCIALHVINAIREEVIIRSHTTSGLLSVRVMAIYFLTIKYICLTTEIMY